MENLKILTQLKAVIQADVIKKFGNALPDRRSLEAVREHGQKLLDTYVQELMKQSPDLQKQWSLGHPFKITSHMSVQTRTFEIDITSKDNPPPS
jgi:uncharacterized protein YaaR (DUF327 family)